MKIFKLDTMTRGWFVGNFTPTTYKTNLFEVAIKKYKKGEKEDEHTHKFVDEITAVIEGEIKMNGVKYISGDIILINKNEKCLFESVTDSITVVVKSGSVQNDKEVILK